MTQTILLVDDETTILDILSTWLEEAGYQTQTATNGYDGLVALNQIQPDLVVTDILMPQMDGYELCRIVRELTPAPIMFLTGLGRSFDRTTGLRAGGHDFLTKPVSMSVFLQHVAQLIRQSGPSSLPMIDILR